MKLSNLSYSLVGQKMFQILAQCKELESKGKKILHFEIGDPDFSTPSNIAIELNKQIKLGNTKYSISQGLLEFRELASKVTNISRGFTPSVKQIMVTPGANAQIFYAISVLVNKNEEVITTDPCFVSYDSVLKMLEIKNVKIPLKESNNFVISASDLEKKITKKTKMIILNSPSNPTGSIIDKKTYTDIYDLACSKGIYIYSDEVYARMVYDDVVGSKKKNIKFFSPSSLDHCKKYVLLSQSFSKSYSMTGWRIGAITAHEEIIEKMTLLQETIYSCVSPFIQKAAIDGMKNSKNKVTKMMIELKKRRDLIVEGLNSIKGFSCISPDGSFYVFPNIKSIHHNSEELCKEILSKTGVASCPGSYFGDHGEGYIRFCYANSRKNITLAIKKLKNHFS
jgi:aspartate/methionine/tyrosine aminotransferase